MDECSDVFSICFRFGCDTFTQNKALMRINLSFNVEAIQNEMNTHRKLCCQGIELSRVSHLFVSYFLSALVLKRDDEEEEEKKFLKKSKHISFLYHYVFIFACCCGDSEVFLSFLSISVA